MKYHNTRIQLKYLIRYKAIIEKHTVTNPLVIEWEIGLLTLKQDLIWHNTTARVQPVRNKLIIKAIVIIITYSDIYI